MDAQRASTDGPTCPGCLARDRRIAALEARVAAQEARIAQLEVRVAGLEAKLEALARGAKRQAAPFSKGPPAADPKRPGRKSGDYYGTKAFRAVCSRVRSASSGFFPP